MTFCSCLSQPLQRILLIIIQLQTYTMSYKITVKIGETNPLLVHKNQLSELEIKKKKSLYQQPERDRQPLKKGKTVDRAQKKEKIDRHESKAGMLSSGEEENYRKAQKKMMEDLDKMGKNQVSLDMIRNSNNIQQKQNQILEENQKAIYNLVKNSQPSEYDKSSGHQLKEVLRQVIKEVDEIRKMRDQIISAGKQLSKAINESSKGGKQVSFEGTQNIAEMNSNLKNLAEVSKNQLEGLQNLQAIKNLQNFNIQNYTQSINALKKQIVQYQKQSQNIERQLKLRAAKLQKLQVNPNINDKILAPYENYLKKKADAIDMHALRQKVYQKLGLFDYAKFECDANQIMAEVRGQMNQFAIICKQYRVQAPDIKIDPRQLKHLDIKLNSALDEYKAERGIQFVEQNVNKGFANTGEMSESIVKRTRRSGQAIVNRKGVKQIPKAIRQLNTKPLDLATQVKLQKPQALKKTILQNRKQYDKKSVQKNIKKGKLIKQEDFDKFLQNRANEELEQLYKEKRERLQRQKKQLYQEIKEEPLLFLNLNLKNQIQKDNIINKKKQEPIINQPEEKQEKEPAQHFEELKPINEGQAIKSIGTEVLRQKLKNILGKSQNQNNNRLEGPNYPYINALHENEVPKMQSMAENFINLINNTLTQVNNQISQTIQTKYEQRSLSKDKKQYQKRSPAKMTIPKLQQFRPPPTFNMQYMQPTDLHTAVLPMDKRPETKILPKSYQHLQIKDELDYGDLEISGESYQQDFQ